MTTETETTKGLTEVKETMRGFVGTRGLSNQPANNGRQRIRFDLVAGNTDLSKLIYPTWRHCVGYDDVAIQLSELKSKEYLKIEGYLKTEIRRDAGGKPMFLYNGEPITVDIFMVQKVTRLNHAGRQYKMFEGWPSGASDMVVTSC
jgi:hypothetical protein